MEPMAARALLAMQLSPEQREKLRKYELSLPPGRYLQGAEVCRLFKLKPTPASAMDTDTLAQMWQEYRKRVLWKLNQLEDVRHQDKCKDVKDGWCYCRKTQEEVHDWEDWAAENFGQTMEEITWTIPEPVMQKVQAKSRVDSYLGF